VPEAFFSKPFIKRMSKDFHQILWDDVLTTDWRAILQLAVREDLADAGDWTTRALVPEEACGQASIVARQTGVVAGLPGVEMTLAAIEPRLYWTPLMKDGQPVRSGDQLGVIAGPVRGMLSAERLVLNLLGHLSGIATLTQQYVQAVMGTQARIYDTRKTTPGWRRLEKYAVRCGGGCNHRGGLFEAVLIKDNHLAAGAMSSDQTARYTPGQAVAKTREYIRALGKGTVPFSSNENRDSPQLIPLRNHIADPAWKDMIVEVEVDTLEQLSEVLPAGPDIVLLDNMSPEMLRKAVARRNAINPAIELEASGGINLQTVRSVAETGIERISVGALTHSAASLDIALDWLP
jgi:nicotinate-nucleotide pyrophosphorylase (carboxylating)